MRYQGRITRWKDERGFGFIVRNDGATETFAHISDFATHGRRPVAGDLVTYETTDESGKLKASGIRFVERSARAHATPRRATRWLRRIGLAGAAAAIVAAALIDLSSHGWFERMKRSESQKDDERPAAKMLGGIEHSCEGKTHCSQMTSCEEAEFYLHHCPDVQIDGDGDGIPCEQQWCH